MVDIKFGPPTKEEFINSTQNLAWPFLTFKLKRTTKPITNPIINIDIGPTLYNLLMKRYGTDEVQIYFVPSDSPFCAWSPDMSIAFEIMVELNFMGNIDKWIRVARDNITDVLNNKPTSIPPRTNNNAIAVCEELLKACKLFKKVSASELLLGLAKDSINKKNRDPDTVIYRLAMAVYHYVFLDEPVVSGLEDWASAYLYLPQDTEVNKKYPFIMKKISRVPPNMLQLTFKTTLAFIIASYLYYRGVKEIG